MKLEDFIHQHRSDFEEEGPAPRVWAALEKELPVRKRPAVVRMMVRHWWKAAILVALIANVGILLKMMNVKKDAGAVLPEMEEMQVYYSSRIEKRLDELKALPPEQLGLDSATRKELEIRNDTYKLLEKELLNNPGNQRIRAAMIRYYQMKLELLDRILSEQEKYNNETDTPSNKKDVI